MICIYLLSSLLYRYMFRIHRRAIRFRDRRQARLPVREWFDDEFGGTSVEFLVAMASALLIMVFLFNAVLMLYARSVMQHAADLGARSAARSGGTEATCEAMATTTIESLAAVYADDTSVGCRKERTATSATIQADIGPVFGDIGPRWRFTIRSTVATEPFT